MNHFHRFAIAALVGLLLGESCAVAQVKSRDKNMVFELRELVGSLANRNTSPRIVEGHVRDGKVDGGEQTRVWKVIKSLVERLEEARPLLVDHLEDGRYSITVSNQIFGTEANWTIGDVCREIIARSLSQAYYEKLQPESSEVYRLLRIPDVALNGKELKEWCLARSKKKLYELQMEICKSASRKIKQEGKELGVADDVRSGWIRDIDKAIESLSKSRRAVSYKGFGPEEITPYTAPPNEDPFADK